MRSVSSPRAVSMTIGTSCLRRMRRQNLEAVRAGEHHVEEDDVVSPRLEPLEPERAGLDRLELHAVGSEVLAEQARELEVVVDEEGAHGGLLSRWHAAGGARAQACAKERKLAQRIVNGGPPGPQLLEP